MEINISDMVWAVLNFGIMVVLLTYFLYKPVLRVLDNRRNMIFDQQKQSNLALQDAQNEKSSARLELATAHKEAQTILTAAQQSGVQHKQYATEQAEQIAAELVAAAHAEIARERQKAQGELREQVASLSLALTGQLVSELTDEAAHSRLVTEFFSRLDDEPLRNRIASGGGKSVTVCYAHELNEQHKELLCVRLAMLGLNTQPQYKHTPALLGGATVQIDDLLIDGSLNGRLERIKTSLLPAGAQI